MAEKKVTKKKGKGGAVDVKSGKVLTKVKTGRTIEQAVGEDYPVDLDYKKEERELKLLFQEIHDARDEAKRKLDAFELPRMRQILSRLPYVYMKKDKFLEPKHAKSFPTYLRHVYGVETTESYKMARVIEGLARFPHLIKYLDEDCIISDFISKLRTLFNGKNEKIQKKYLADNEKSLNLLQLVTNKEIAMEGVVADQGWKHVPRMPGYQIPISYNIRGRKINIVSEIEGLGEIFKVLMPALYTRKNITVFGQFAEKFQSKKNIKEIEKFLKSLE